MVEKFVVETQPNNIAAFTDREGITIAELARRAGTHDTRISDIRRGRRPRIKAENAKKIAAALNASPGEVFPRYEQAKAEYTSKIEQTRETIFVDRAERDAAILDSLFQVECLAKKYSWKLKKCRNLTFDIEDIISEAYLQLVLTAEQVSQQGIAKNVEFPRYVCGAIEQRFSMIYREQQQEKRAMYLTVSLDAPTPLGDGATYWDYWDSLAMGGGADEQFFLIEECREAVRGLTQRQRNDRRIQDLLLCVGL